MPPRAWKSVGWREGSKRKLCSRFAGRRVRIAHRDDWRSEPHGEEWLPIEMPAGESEPTKYWPVTPPADTRQAALAKWAKHRWIMERVYEELEQELGLGHSEGRGWRGLHHHATLCLAAYSFLLAERSRFSPAARAGRLGLRATKVPPYFVPRAAPRARRAAQPGFDRRAPNPARPDQLRQLTYCPFCGGRRLLRSSTRRVVGCGLGGCVNLRLT